VPAKTRQADASQWPNPAAEAETSFDAAKAWFSSAGLLCGAARAI